MKKLLPMLVYVGIFCGCDAADLLHDSTKRSGAASETSDASMEAEHTAMEGFVHQGGRIQRPIDALPAQLSVGQRMQLFVQERHKRIEGFGIALSQRCEQSGNLLLFFHAWLPIHPR